MVCDCLFLRFRVRHDGHEETGDRKACLGHPTGGMAEGVDTISQETTASGPYRTTRDSCCNDATCSLLEFTRSIPECISCTLWMVVLRMHELSEKKGLVWASISVLSLILVLLVMTSISGGFAGLSGSLQSLAYAGVVMVPLLIVVFLAFKKPIETSKKEQRVIAGTALSD